MFFFLGLCFSIGYVFSCDKNRDMIFNPHECDNFQKPPQ